MNSSCENDDNDDSDKDSENIRNPRCSMCIFIIHKILAKFNIARCRFFSLNTQVPRVFRHMTSFLQLLYCTSKMTFGFFFQINLYKQAHDWSYFSYSIFCRNKFNFLVVRTIKVNFFFCHVLPNLLQIIKFNSK